MSIQAKKAVLGGVLVLAAIPAVYFTLKGAWAYLAPELYEGDRLETRPCRQCRGTGKCPELEMAYPSMGDACPFCRGQGHVDVIVPGPKRPTRVWGAVLDLRKVGAEGLLLTPLHVRRLSVPFGPEGPPLPGAIARARVVFTGDGAPVEVEADDGGRFSRRLPPGSYRVSVAADGFETLEGEIEIAPLTAPIWLEKASLVEELPEDQARSQYGLTLLAGLGRRGEEGELRVTTGSPH